MLLFLILEIRVLMIPASNMIQTIAVIINCKHTLMCITNASLILGLIFNDRKIAFIFLVVGGGVAVALAILEFLNVAEQSEEIPACEEKNCVGIYSFYIGFKNQTKNSIDDLIKRISVHYFICNNP